MSDTKTNRVYGWGVQTDYITQVTLAAGALRKLLATDANSIDYTPETQNDEDWSHGFNSATDQWIIAHDAKVSHTIPGHAQELGRVFYINLGSYTPSTPSGAVTAKLHTFKPTDPSVTRQDKAVTYIEKLGSGWHKLMPDAVSDGFVLTGEGNGILTVDFNLLGSGRILNNPTATYPPTATPTVVQPTGLYKLHNTMVRITPDDGNAYTDQYACSYRKFTVNFQKTMLAEAGFKPGCKRYLIDNDTESGIIRSAYEFDKQMVEFNFNVDMVAGTPEFECVQDQRPIALVIEAIGKEIETGHNYRLKITLHITRYNTTKPVENQGILNFDINGKGFIDVATGDLITVELTNDIATYATGW